MNCEPFVVSLNIYGNTADEPFSTAFLGPNLRTILKTNWTHWIFRPIISVLEKNTSIIRKLFSNVQKINYDCLHFSILPSNLTGRRRGNEVWLLLSISGWALIWVNRSCSYCKNLTTVVFISPIKPSILYYLTFMCTYTQPILLHRFRPQKLRKRL